MKSSTILIRLLLALFLSFGTALPASAQDDNLELGNPSHATASTTAHNNYLMTKRQYALSYNSSTGTPNWVSWHLSSAWRGSYKRTNPFKKDAKLPAGYYRVSPGSYTRTGFDRGHMCPSADRNLNKADNNATFLMTNMVPQSPVCNRQTWGDLEDYCRSLTDKGQELYIIAGPLGQRGTGSEGSALSIANGKIQVPEFVWKVILIIPVGENDLTRVNKTTRAIAVKIPNNESVNAKHWFEYRTTIDEIEQQTGYDFFSLLDDAIEREIESKIDRETIDH